MKSDSKTTTGGKASAAARATDRLIKHGRDNESIVIGMRRLVAKVDAAMRELEAAATVYFEFGTSTAPKALHEKEQRALEALREGLAHAAGDGS